ncbi:MAG: hypothetical protein GY950_06765 [bacterium]|nr:hypothetical protein [bacterium]
MTIKIIKELRILVESQGRKFSVIFIPLKDHITGGIEYNHPMVPPLANLLKESGIEYFEPYFDFLQKEKEGPSLYNQFDNHFSKKGHVVYANFFVNPELIRKTRNYYHQ